MDKEDKVMSCVGWVLAWMSALVVSIFMDGWALSTVWNWFMPRIFSVVTLTLMQSVGVSMVFSLFTRTNRISSSESKEKKTSLEKWIETLGIAVFVPLFTVGMAWVILQFAF